MRLTLALIAAAGVAIIAVTAVAFQDNITRFNLKPRTPFQIYSPPPPPAYDARGGWVLWPASQGSGAADVFYVHSTTFSSRAGWNAPVNDRESDRVLRDVAAPNEAGPFMRVGAVYGPRFRQATLFASFTHKYDGLAARELAYRDVEKAFVHFLKIRDSERPIILAGYGQGGLHVIGLLQTYFANNEDLRDYLAAAYIIEEPAPLSLFDYALNNVPPCTSKKSVRCVISYIDIQPGFDGEASRRQARALRWRAKDKLVSLKQEPLLCVNPLSWKVDEKPVSAEAHLGAASATGLRLSETPPAIAKATGAQCVDGVLRVDAPRQSFLRRKHWFGDHWRPQNFNLFYHDLTADAARRVKNLNAVLEDEYLNLEPIEEPVDLDVSPVNKVPD